MSTGIMSDVHARLVKREYRNYQSTFDSKGSNDLKLNEKRQFLCKFLLSLVGCNFFCVRKKILGFECFPVNCFIHSNPPRLTFQVVRCQAQSYNKLLINFHKLGTVLGEYRPQSSVLVQTSLCSVRTRKTSGNILPARPSCSVNKK